MPTNTYKGVLIVFDGIDGAGKTTQVDILSATLSKAGLTVVTSKEPTNGEWGQKIRRSAFDGRMSLSDELHAFIMDRKEHLEQLIEPALARGEVVILDRYYYSTICYQGARGESPQELRNAVMASAIIPDVTFIMDIDPELSQKRIEVRDGAPNEFENLGYLIEVRRIYEWLCKEDHTLYEIDSSFSVDVISETILEVLKNGIFKEKLCFKSYGCDDEYLCGFAMTNQCRWSNLRKELPKSQSTPYPALKYHYVVENS